MGTTTKGFPYPEGSDPVVQGDDKIKELAQFLDTLVPFRMYVGTVTVALNNVATGNANVNFPAGRFTQPPRVFAIVRATTTFYAFVNGGVTAASASVGIRHHTNALTTANVPVDVWAVQMLAAGADG